MTAKTIMVQGTGSGVGKSLLVTALCRIFRQDGHSVAPFKAQNMSLNSYVTLDGAEIGRAQVVQAEAARVLPTADMNPVLLKPEADHRSQLVVMGRPVGTLESRVFNRRKEGLWDVVTGSLERLRAEFDIVVIEGAGSPAEINLREGDIVNMEVALYANAPVLLVGDIDKGGVFASLYGTASLLAPNERALLQGVVINKFRGDMSILAPGLRQLEELINVPVLGVVPYFRDIYMPEEDSPASQGFAKGYSGQALIDVAVLALPHISNFDDFDPLAREESVGVRYVHAADELGLPDLLIIPGTKTTVADLKLLRETGIADRILSLDTGKTAVIGICGGYQMLGDWILDMQHVESAEEKTPGLGLLPVTTRFESSKQTRQVAGRVNACPGLLEGSGGLSIEGYEIHMGDTFGEAGGQTRAPFRLSRSPDEAQSRPDGLTSGDGWILGTYVHGIFHNTALRRGILSQVALRRGLSPQFSEDTFSQSDEYDKLASLVRSSLDMDAIYEMVGASPDRFRE